MKLTKNKWYLVFGLVMVPLGLFQTVMGLLKQGQPAGGVPWVKLGPLGLMLIIAGIGLLFLPNNKNPNK